MGNHEDMLLCYLDNTSDSWLFNGYRDTLRSYAGKPEVFRDDVGWMRNLPLYYEDDKFICVHAGIDLSRPMPEQDRDTMLWARGEFLDNPEPGDKKVIFGHTPSLMITGSDLPFFTAGDHIGIDTGCVFGGALTALIIEDGEMAGYRQVRRGDAPRHV